MELDDNDKDAELSSDDDKEKDKDGTSSHGNKFTLVIAERISRCYYEGGKWALCVRYVGFNHMYERADILIAAPFVGSSSA